MIQLETVPLLRIAIGTNASALTEYAASELQKYLKKSLGCSLPVTRTGAEAGCFFIAEQSGAFEPGKFDRTLIEGRDGCVNILGENPVSVLYAVYDFLKMALDIRFFAPGEAFESIPVRESLKLAEGMSFRGGSAFEIRDFVNRTNNPEVLSFAVKNRINTILGCGPWVNGSEQCSAENAALIRSFGLRVRGPGHSWKHFVPEEALFESHPEYFPLTDGKRTPNGRTACFSNPEVRRIFRENLRSYLHTHPYWDIFAFWAEDLPDYIYCDCLECRKMKTTDWYFTLVNDAAEVVAQELPDSRFELIIYQGTLEPPEQVRHLYRNGENMLVDICIGQIRDLFNPFAKGTCTSVALHAVYKNWRRYLKEINYAGKTLLMEYYNLCEYPNTGPCGRAFLWPLEVIREDIHYYRREGIDGLGAFTGLDKLCFPTPWRMWAWLQLWIDPDQSLPGLKEEFYGKFFGEDAGAVRDYFEIFERLMLEPVTEENIAALKALSIRGGERCDAIRLHLHYAILLKRMMFAYKRNDSAAWPALKAEYFAFPEENAAALSRLAAPFPLLWYHHLPGNIGWDEAGNKIPLRPGTESMLH